MTVEKSLTLSNCGRAPAPGSADGFRLEDLPIEIACPKCGNEMVRDPTSLPLVENRRGALIECGECGAISQWSFSGDPIEARQVPITWGKKP